MKKFYIVDPDGKYPSADGSTHFSLLKGAKLYAFLKTPEGAEKRFLLEKDNNGDEIGVEITDPELIAEADRDREHQKYIIKHKRGFIVSPLDTVLTADGDEMTGEEVIAVPDANVEADLLLKLKYETLRKAINALEEDEHDLIKALFFDKLSEAEYGQKIGKSQQSVSKAKIAILAKMKKYF